MKLKTTQESAKYAESETPGAEHRTGIINMDKSDQQSEFFKQSNEQFMKKNKVYVVFVGSVTGVFAKPWVDVEPYVKHYPQARFKGYKSMQAAELAWLLWQQNNSKRRA